MLDWRVTYVLRIPGEIYRNLRVAVFLRNRRRYDELRLSQHRDFNKRKQPDGKKKFSESSHQLPLTARYAVFRGILMTKTGAITVLAHGASLVFAQFVVARMAPGAVRLECRETPDDGLGVTFMACPAGRTCGMVERLVAEHRVLEVGWHPGGRGVAIGTLLRSQEVSCRFASRHDAVVAARTRTQHLRVVDADHRYPRARAMAVFTHVGGARMRGALARGIDTVVTAKAVAENVGVIKVRRQPGHSCMAVVAVVATGDVGVCRLQLFRHGSCCRYR
mgnify:CR=1 FL=1